MEPDKIYIIKKKHWVSTGGRVELLCPKDMTPMRQIEEFIGPVWSDASTAMCPDCGFEYKLNISLKTAREDIINILNAQKFRKMEMIDIDGVNTPVLKKKASSEDGKYFATVQINESKRGPQLVIYAGEKGTEGKAQIFVTPETKKMSFDHKDIKPTDIFTKITAEFVDGSINEIRESSEKK